MAHTPGPWKVGFDNGVSAGLLDRNPGYIAVTAPAAPFAFGCAVAITERADDARLIAAAPDMLAALKYGLDLLEHYGACEQVDAMRAAIAKAEIGPQGRIG